MATSSIDKTRRIQARYEGHARHYDASVALIERLLLWRLRRLLWRGMNASLVLEIGVGTGRNLSFYSPTSRVVAIDLSPAMLRQAVEKAAAARRPVDFVLADAEHLPFSDYTFDAAVASCVFCSVPDPVAGFRETRRVLKGGGRLLLLEHVRASNRVLAGLMDVFNSFTEGAGGESINRNTVESVRAAGFELEREESWLIGIVKLLRARRQEVERDAAQQ